VDASNDATTRRAHIIATAMMALCSPQTERSATVRHHYHCHRRYLSYLLLIASPIDQDVVLAVRFCDESQELSSATADLFDKELVVYLGNGIIKDRTQTGNREVNQIAPLK